MVRLIGTRKDVLSALDTRAIAAMRAQKLVWSGWGDAAALEAAHEVIGGSFGARAKSWA